MFLVEGRPAAEAWAEDRGWEIVEISVRGQAVHLLAVGPKPAPDPPALRAELDQAARHVPVTG